MSITLSRCRDTVCRFDLRKVSGPSSLPHGDTFRRGEPRVVRALVAGSDPNVDSASDGPRHALDAAVTYDGAQR